MAEQQYEKLSAAMMDSSNLASEEIRAKMKRLSQLERLVTEYRKLRQVVKELEEVKALSMDSSDEELSNIAKEEYKLLAEKAVNIEAVIVQESIPKDDADESNAIMEIRAGVGGSEASLFVTDLLNMYQALAQRENWKFDILSTNVDDAAGGIREVTIEISGMGVYGKLRFEAGVHRVQRIPVTDNSGRVHTSTASIAILPQPTDVQNVEIRQSDLRIDTYRAQGAGGQHVNKTESAVRITHIPTGLVVAIQDERSQHKNRAKAMRILKARLYQSERDKLDAERKSSRKEQIGMALRSDKTRTYNYPQNRVTDHIIGETIHGIEYVMNEEGLESLIQKRRQYHELMLMSEFESEEGVE